MPTLLSSIPCLCIPSPLPLSTMSTLHAPIAISNRSAKRLLADLTTLYGKHRTNISRTLYLTIFLALIARVRRAVKEQKAAAIRIAEAKRHGSIADGEGKKQKVELNREFFRNLGRLLRVCIPGWKSREARLIASHSVFLVMRTLISKYVAELDGRIVSSLVKGKGKAFLKGLVWWMIVAVPATFTNSMVSRTYHLECRDGHSNVIDAARIP